ncbi:MAG: hypothetical protein EPO40_05110 [Myxococcaceae bacterium]|nr:MAG: hypothetical protein EPO40_05110 [Myxococcaceae bacterium]
MAKPKNKSKKPRTGKTVMEAIKEALKKPKAPVLVPKSVIFDFGAAVIEYSESSGSSDVGSEWDIGVFEVFDGANVVALLYVTDPYNDLTKTKEYWGLGPSYTWPDDGTTMTYKYDHSATLTAAITSPTTFKDKCDAIWGPGNTVFIKATNAPF